MKPNPKAVERRVKAWAYSDELKHDNFIMTKRPDRYGQKVLCVITYSLPTPTTIKNNKK